MEKKYQVFISSTYNDLLEERHEVMQALLELDCIPVGMELFQADDNDQWTLIQRLIKDCDYYIVIIGGKYGTQHHSGLSYTEMEYQYATENGIPTIGFIYRFPEKLSVAKSENDPDRLNKLNNFKGIVQKRMINYWESPTDLGGKVSRSLIKLIKNNPRSGWVKADKLANDEAVKRILSLSDEIDALTRDNKKLEKNESLYKDIIRNNIVSFGKIIKDTKNALYHEMFHAVELSFKYSADNLNQILDSSLEIITDVLADIIKNQIKTKNVDDEISVSIKAFVNEKNAKKILEDKSDKIQGILDKNEKEHFIITLARDSKTVKNYPNREIKRRPYKIGRNSDFSRILAGEDYFISNDLISESEESAYINESPNWKDNYNATTVVPIYYLPKGKEVKQIFGFLTVDSLNKKGVKLFNKKDTVPILEFGAEVLTIIFLNLGLFDNKH